MKRIITGQILLIVCCAFYLIWWYRCFQPNKTVNRINGMNGMLLLMTALFGIAGVVFSLMPGDAVAKLRINPSVIVMGGVAAYIILLLLTRYGFHRIVTSELFLIVGWTMLEVTVINRLNAAGNLSDAYFFNMCWVISVAFIISIVLYVAYYRVEEMRAFYLAMIPLVTEAAAMAALIACVE